MKPWPFSRRARLREQLALHAPPQPLWHIQVPMPSPRPEPQAPFDKTGAPANVVEIRRWDDEREARRRALWPWIWADAALHMEDYHE